MASNFTIRRCRTIRSIFYKNKKGKENREESYQDTKAPVIFKAAENVSWSSPRLYIKDGVKTIVMNRHVSDGDHTETVQVASSSRDLTYWTVPSVFEADSRREKQERKQSLPELAAEIAADWELPTEAVQSGLETLRSHLELVQSDAALLYEMT